MMKSTHFLLDKASYSFNDYARMYIKELLKLQSIPLPIILDRGTQFTLYFLKSFHVVLPTWLVVSPQCIHWFSTFSTVTKHKKRSHVQLKNRWIRAYMKDDSDLSVEVARHYKKVKKILMNNYIGPLWSYTSCLFVRLLLLI